ncbi:hypothetical protein ACHAXS_004012 [Conticribra weissflogii]
MNDVVTQRFTFLLHHEQCRRLGLFLLDCQDFYKNADCLSIRNGGNTDDKRPVPHTHNPRSNKRKRTNALVLSESSVVFIHAANILKAAKAFFNSKDDIAKDVSYPDTLDELLDWGRTNVRPLILPDFGTISVDDLNSDIMKLALARAIKPNDIFEKIQYSTSAKTIHNRKYRHKSYLRSDYYNTMDFNQFPINAADATSILRKPESYPLYLTLKRLLPKDLASVKSCCDPCCPPLQKRQKTSQSINANPTENSGVICLLDSSDEEDEKFDLDSKGQPLRSQSAFNQIDKYDVQSLGKFASLIVPPDPPLLPLHHDEFVLTPFGPGKILSWRVERHALGSTKPCKILSHGTVYNPTLIYSIDLDYGICHIPASQVKSISGTPYTEHTLLTYHRVPITEFDLLRLRPLTYLNDTIVNFYLKYLKVKYDEKYEKRTKEKNACISSEENARTMVPERPSAKNSRRWDDLDGNGVYIFPSFFYTRMVNIFDHSPTRNKNNKANRNKLWSSLKSWTKGVDIFKKKLLIFPINGSLHWTFVCVFHPGRLVRRYSTECKDEAKRLVALAEKVAFRKKNGQNLCQSKTKIPSAPVKAGADHKRYNKDRSANSSKMPGPSISTQPVKKTVSTKDQAIINDQVGRKDETSEATSTKSTAGNLDRTENLGTKGSLQFDVQSSTQKKSGAANSGFLLKDEVSVEGSKPHVFLNSQSIDNIDSVEPLERGVMSSDRNSERRNSKGNHSESFDTGVFPNVNLQTHQESARSEMSSLVESVGAVKERNRNQIQSLSAEISVVQECKPYLCEVDEIVQDLSIQNSTQDILLALKQSTVDDVVMEQSHTDISCGARSTNISLSTSSERSGIDPTEKESPYSSRNDPPGKGSGDSLGLRLPNREEKSNLDRYHTTELMTSPGFMSGIEWNEKSKTHNDGVVMSEKSSSPPITSTSRHGRNENQTRGQNGVTSVAVSEDLQRASVVEENSPSFTGQLHDPPNDVRDQVANNGRKECIDPSMENCENNCSLSSRTNGMDSIMKSKVHESKLTQPPKWKCDFCNEKVFAEFEDAEAHEKICDKNIDWCMIHFDSGKHFKLHSTRTIFEDIRKYLFAFYEGEYIESHPDMPSITHERMPGWSVPVPVQDNAKDCGVYMLHIIEKLLTDTPRVDRDFVCEKSVREKYFGKNMFGKDVIESKRGDILQLVHKLRTGRLD